MSFVASTNKYVQILHFHGTSFLQPIMFDPSGSVTCLPLKANALTLQRVTAKSHIFSHSIPEAIMRLRHSCARSQASFFFRSVPSIYKFCYALVDKGIALTSMMWIPRGDPCFTFSLYSRRLRIPSWFHSLQKHNSFTIVQCLLVKILRDTPRHGHFNTGFGIACSNIWWLIFMLFFCDREIEPPSRFSDQASIL